jgi:broad specificity phosphatase PhoE
MNSLLFIRHAETDLAGRFCGHADPPVNERGIRQINDLLGRLQGERFDAIYTSDLRRAVTTAEAIGDLSGIRPIALPQLREIGFGEWETLTWQEIELRDPGFARQWSEAYPDLPAPRGEPFQEFRSRILSQVDHLMALEPQGCAAVVTHAGVMRIVLRSLCGLDEQEAWSSTQQHCCSFRYAAGGLQ